MKSAPLTLVFVTMLLASCATDPGRSTFLRLDGDGDGQVTEAEFAGHIHREAFDVLDSDGDGRVSKSEWAAKETREHRDQLFQKTDVNHDGAIVLDELTAEPGSPKRREIDEVFHTLDRNHDGVLEWNELTGP